MLVVFLSYNLYSFSLKSNSVFYIDNIKLFDGFKMTQEMKLAGEKEFNQRKHTLDSLYLEVQREDISEQHKESLMQSFISKREEFDQFNKAFAQEESSKIWLRINNYTKEFSKENNYKLIIGSSNQGNVLFADESIDITTELLYYINKKYDGL